MRAERGHDLLAEDARVIVGEGALGRAELGVEGDRLLAFADALPAVDVEDGQVAELRPACLLGRRDEVAGRDVLPNDEGEILAKGREGDHVLVDESLRKELEQRLEVELEDPPLPFEERWVELADPAGLDPRSLARMEERLFRAFEARLDLERGEKRFDGAARNGEAALGDGTDAPPLLREPSFPGR